MSAVNRQELEETPCQRFRRYAQTHHDQPALARKVRGKWDQTCWREYYNQARAVGLALKEMGIRSSETVAILAENHPEWLYVDWGSRCMGMVSVGIYPTATPQHCEFILNNSGAKVVFVENDVQLDKIVRIRKRCPNLAEIVVIDSSGLWDLDDPQIVTYSRLIEQGYELANIAPEAFDVAVDRGQPGDIALLAYTTGTTGHPKGVVISNDNLMFQMDRAHLWLEMAPSSRSFCIISLAHITERLLAAFFPLALGHLVHFPESVSTVASDLKEVRPQLMLASPRLWEEWHARSELSISESVALGQFAYHQALDTGRSRLKGVSNKLAMLTLRVKHAFWRWLVLDNIKRNMGLIDIRHALVGVAPVSTDLVWWFSALGIPLREVYGLTEACGFCCVDLVGRSVPGLVGSPLPNVEVRISEAGEVLLRGGNIFGSYWNQSPANSGIDEEGWLHTGDTGTFVIESQLKITDRMKSLMVLTSGQKISPARIEDVLRNSPYFADAIVIGDNRDYLVCIVLLDKESIIAFAEKRQVPYTDFSSLLRSEDVGDLVRREVAKANERLELKEQLKDFRIIPDDSSGVHEILTPNMRLKRFEVEIKYRELIDSMYLC